MAIVTIKQYSVGVLLENIVQNTYSSGSHSYSRSYCSCPHHHWKVLTGVATETKAQHPNICGNLTSCLFSL